MAQSIFILAIILIFIHEFWEQLLTILNIKYLKTNTAVLPKILRDKIDNSTLLKITEYTQTKEKFSIISSLFSFIFLLAILFSGILNKIDLIFWDNSSPDGWSGVMYCIVVSLLFSIISIPFNIYQTFVIEQKYGFNKTTKKLYIIDFIKSLVISIAIVAPLLRLLFYLVDLMGDSWWTGGWMTITLFQLLMLWLYPTIIAPLFNKFTPLEDAELNSKIDELTIKAGFKSNGVFLMDGSKRSSHSNAYFTGIGKSKRIVLFDTLIKQLSQPELLNVLAHELGHFKKKHIRNMLVLNFFIMGFSFYIISLILKSPAFFEAFSMDNISLHSALVLISLISPSFLFIFTPLFNWKSRKHEYEADKYSINLLKQPEEMAKALVNLAEKNLSNLTPHPWYSFYHYSHPGLIERINHIMNYKSN